jgi:DNA-binding transcriptional regulator YdaS (Cro superfamily)
MAKPPKITPLNEAIGVAGGIVALSRQLNLKSHTVINNWRNTQVPAEHCPSVEEATGVRCERLRPDVKWYVLRNSGAQPAP